MALNAIVTAAGKRGYEQRVIVAAPHDDPSPKVADLPDKSIHPLVFPAIDMPFALPGMSDVMPYESSVFSQLRADQLKKYQHTWTQHVAAVIAEFQPELIHCHHVWLLSSLLKDVAATIPVVVHCHATGLRQMVLCPHLAEAVSRGCSRSEAFVVLHRGHAVELAEKLGVSMDRISIVGSGYDASVFYPADEVVRSSPLIAYAGKLSHAKGLPQLLDVMDRLQKTHPQVLLQIAGTGSGDEATAIRDRVGTMSNVEWLGQVDQPRLAQLFRQATVFVLASFYEGLPLVLVEAAACGCQLVASELPGIVEQLKPVLGDRLNLVPLPEMESIDRPLASGLPDFVNRLETSIVAAMVHSGDDCDIAAGLRDMSWAGVFQRIEAVWSRVLN